MSGAEMEENVEPMPMPMPIMKTKRKNLFHEQLYLDNLPNGNMYEKSYMHRDVITHTLFCPETQYLITASKDGHVKFWKKMVHGIEFVKHYKAHMKEITDMKCSNDGLSLATCSLDRQVKFYTVLSFDMICMLTLEYTPSILVWFIHSVQKSNCLAIADLNTSSIRIYTCEGAPTLVHEISSLHKTPLAVMAYHIQSNCIISGDKGGMIEYWHTDTYVALKPSDSIVTFEYKVDTDLYDLAKAKTIPTSLVISMDGTSFAITALDQQVRVFRFASGKLRRKYDESLSVFEDAHADNTLQLDNLDYGKRMAVEKEVLASGEGAPSNVVFDASGNFIFFPTLLGIKCINLITNALVRVLGRVENTERFLSISLFQGVPHKDTQYQGSVKKKIKLMSETELEVPTDLVDPILVASAYKKNRFYTFTKREPTGDEETERDVFNEKPVSLVGKDLLTEKPKELGSKAVMHTDIGDIVFKLFPEECPRTVENFCTHARNGYYDKTIFHRVIKNFMVQGGDPAGDGTGGKKLVRIMMIMMMILCR